jgi:hypothetical protein
MKQREFLIALVADAPIASGSMLWPEADGGRSITIVPLLRRTGGTGERFLLAYRHEG